MNPEEFSVLLPEVKPVPNWKPTAGFLAASLVSCVPVNVAPN